MKEYVVAVALGIVFVAGIAVGGMDCAEADDDGVQQQQCSDYWCNPDWYSGIEPDPPVGRPHYTNPRNYQQNNAPRPTHNPPGERSGGGQYQNPQN